jgi:hypothetical protein
VDLALFAWTKDQAFAREFVAAHLEARGVDVVESGAELRLRVFASVLGLEQGETLVGLPALQVPVVSVPIPEIALFKWVRNRGHAEIQVHVYDARSGEFRQQLADGVGRSKFDEFTILVFIGFTVTDLDERAPLSTAPADTATPISRRGPTGAPSPCSTSTAPTGRRRRASRMILRSTAMAKAIAPRVPHSGPFPPWS